MMMPPVSALLPCGERLHLQHGPIDLIIHAEGDRAAAFAAAKRRFETVLDEIVAELPLLKQPIAGNSAMPRGEIPQHMYKACLPMARFGYITPMAAVAGAVADTILAAMCDAATLDRAYVNNGGDIAFFLAPKRRYSTAIRSQSGEILGMISLTAEDKIGGIATSGRFGRSHSLGIADSVTILAKNAGMADAAATLTANAVDIHDCHKITRICANQLDEESDLGTQMVVSDCAPLSDAERRHALDAGQDRAWAFCKAQFIQGAALFLQGGVRTIGNAMRPLQNMDLEYV